MSARERKLHELKMRRNEARKANLREVDAERRRINENPEEAAKRAKAEAAKRSDDERASTRAAGVDHEAEAMLGKTAEQAEREHARAVKKQGAGGVDAFDARTRDHWSYEKQSKNVPAYAPHQLVSNSGNVDLNSLDYGRAAKVPAANIDKMVAELDALEKKRVDKRKRVQVWDDADSHHISESNRLFNKRVDKYYGAYTAETKAALERGTAL